MEQLQVLVPGSRIQLTWLPDETLFSLVSRHHVLSGSLHPWITCFRFFGDRRRGSAHDFPCRLDEFETRTDGCLGSAETLVIERTLLPFFLPWRSLEVGTAAVRTLRGDRIESLKFSLGLLTSRFGAQHPLKACPCCLESDLNRHGMPHWRRTHQWPGVWVCPEHGVPLKVSTAKVDGQYRYAWVLPKAKEMMTAGSAWRHSAFGRDEEARLRRLSRLADLSVRSCASGAGLLCDPAALSRTYRERMVALGWLKQPDRLRWNVLEAELAGQLELVVDLPEFARLGVESHALRSHLALLLCGGRGLTHPLRHLLLIEAMFSEWSEFEACYLNARRSETALRDESRPTREARCHGQQRAVPKSSADESARSLARRFSVDVNTAMAWRAMQGFSPDRRSKVLSPERMRYLVSALVAGQPKKEVAASLGVSVSSVTRILRTEPGLQSTWHAVRQERAQALNRGVWSALMFECPSAGRKLLRLQQPAVYAWLYRNDRVWLTTQLAERVPPAALGNNVLMKWHRRDVHLAREVREAALWLAEHAAIQLPALCRAIPELRASMRSLDRLPLTQRALTEVLR